MAWIEAMLHGKRVLARARADGSLDADAGSRVEIRYDPKDGRAYRASARNLVVTGKAEIYPDDACVDVQPGTLAERKPSDPPVRRPPMHAIPKDAWIAYTDGACSGNPGPAGSGVVLVAPGGKMREGHEYLGEATNNVAELSGILRALEWIPADARAIVVHTDSQYAIGVLQKGWKAKVNQELVARTRRLVQERGALLVYVPGHQGVPLNERADELARDAIRTRSTRRAE
jgi:ribonuclease HI